MLNNYRISLGQNLAELFNTREDYCMERFKFYREEMSAHLNYEIKPIHISNEANLEDNLVLLINKDYEIEVYPFEFNNDLEDELDLLLLKMMYLYKVIYKEKVDKND
jgi:hypothetical protein